MSTMRIARLSLLIPFTALAAACGETTAPDLGLDTDAAAADYVAFESVFASEGWAGFAALGARTPWSSSPAAIDAVVGLAEARSGRPTTAGRRSRTMRSSASTPSIRIARARPPTACASSSTRSIYWESRSLRRRSAMPT
jgi:hypothetical protein